MYVALGVTLGVTREVLREVLGLWIAKNEGARFWLPVMNALKTRGTQDILIAIVDGLKGFPEAITAAFPEAMVQTLNFCSWKDRKAVAADLRRIYGAATADLAAAEIDDFEEKWSDIIGPLEIGKWLDVSWSDVLPRWDRGAIIPDPRKWWSNLTGEDQDAGTPPGQGPGPHAPVQRRASGGWYRPGRVLTGEDGPELLRNG